MPELPEVETVKRGLEKALIGKKIKEVRVNNPRVIRQPSCAEFKSGLVNAVFKSVARRAKVLILGLSGGRFLVVHLKMTGQLVYPGNGKKSRVSFLLSDGEILDFNDQRLFAELRLLDDWRSLKFIRQLGPEPFDLSQEEFAKMLGSKKTKIKPLLMDQSFISGIGNLYAAEALFRAGIHPSRAANSLSSGEKRMLLSVIKKTLRDAIRCKGSSVDQYVQLSGERGSYIKHHKVYDRRGKPCLVCATPIKRIPLGGRGTYYCPKCQREDK